MLMMALWPSSTCSGAEVGDGSPLKTGLSEMNEMNIIKFMYLIIMYLLLLKVH